MSYTLLAAMVIGLASPQPVTNISKATESFPTLELCLVASVDLALEFQERNKRGDNNVLFTKCVRTPKPMETIRT